MPLGVHLSELLCASPFADRPPEISSQFPACVSGRGVCGWLRQRTRTRLAAFAIALFLLAASPKAQATSYQWGSLTYAGTLTSGDVCTTDGVFINCTTTPTTTINGTACTLGGSCTISSGGLTIGSTAITGGGEPADAVQRQWRAGEREQLYLEQSAGFLGLGTATASAQFHSGGTLSAAAWTTNGIAHRQDAATYTDTSSTGAVASELCERIGGPTLAASAGAATYTDAATMYIAGPPLAGTNVTITNPATLVVGSGNVGIGTTGPTEQLHSYNNVNLPLRVTVQNANSGTGAFSEFRAMGDVNSFKFGVGSSGNNASVGGGGAGYVGTDNNYPFQLYTNGAERMRITGSGFVGMG